MPPPIIALCVGHSRKINGRTEGGAVSVSGESEHHYNSDLAEKIQRVLAGMRIDSFIVSEYEGAGYGSAQAWLARHLEEKGTTLAVELHFNAADGTARGHEWLHWAASPKSADLARRLRLGMATAFPDLPDRGVKGRDSGDRGAEFLRGTHCPAVICEPFFGDNALDWHHATRWKEVIALVIANGLEATLKSLGG